MQEEPTLADTRRGNLLMLLQEFQTQAIAQGRSSVGLNAEFARQLEIKPAQLSQLKTPAFAIGDKLARQIEHHTGKAAGWLDEDHGAGRAPDEAEEHFIAQARAAWRATNAKGRRELLRAVRALQKEAKERER